VWAQRTDEDLVLALEQAIMWKDVYILCEKNSISNTPFLDENICTYRG
jgi:hypothetical protein